jgi:hypothetical protein
MLERDLGPRAIPRPRYARSECVHTADAQGLMGEACQCATDDNGLAILGPRGAGCLAHGHGGTCLWHGDDVPEHCENDACEAACNELADRFAADDQISYPYTLRYAACVDDRCEGVAAIGDFCYGTPLVRWAHAQDCSLPDSQIIENSREVGSGETTNTCDDVSECSKAYGCRNGICWFCNDSDQCTADEECVNSSCLLSESVDCRSDEECDVTGELCLLFGVEQLNTAPGRGNANLRSECAHPDEL